MVSEKTVTRDFSEQCMMECFELSFDEGKHKTDLLDVINYEKFQKYEKEVKEEFSLFYEHYKPMIDKIINNDSINWKERCLICSQNSRSCPYYRIKESYIKNGSSKIDNYCQNEICKNHQKLICSFADLDKVGQNESVLIKDIIERFDECKFNQTYGYENRCRHFQYINRLRSINSTCRIFKKIYDWFVSLMGMSINKCSNQDFIVILSDRIQKIKNPEEKREFIERITIITKEAEIELEKIEAQKELEKIPKIIKDFISDLGKIKFVCNLKMQADELIEK